MQDLVATTRDNIFLHKHEHYRLPGNLTHPHIDVQTHHLQYYNTRRRIRQAVQSQDSLLDGAPLNQTDSDHMLQLCLKLQIIKWHVT